MLFRSQGSVQKPWLRPGLTPQQRDEEFRIALRKDNPALANDDDSWNSFRQIQPWNQPSLVDPDPEDTRFGSQTRPFTEGRPTLSDEDELSSTDDPNSV